MEPIVNRVAQSGIEVLDLSMFEPDGDPVELDIAPFLVEGLILREKPFRDAVAAFDFSPFAGRLVAVRCSADAIVPTWAWMLVATRLDGIAAAVTVGSPADAMREHFARAVAAFDWSRYADRTVVVKGCGSGRVPEAAYVMATAALQRVARKVMFGEPCSTVPLWRRRSDSPGS